MALSELSNEGREREHEMRAAGRLPPGQSLTLKWPVLHAGSVPRCTLNGFPTYGIESMEPSRQACHTEESFKVLLRLKEAPWKAITSKN